MISSSDDSDSDSNIKFESLSLSSEFENKLTMFLKRLSAGYKPKKSRVLTSENVETFLREAPDEIYLVIKVVLIFGINGACRSSELTVMKTGNLENHNDLLLVKVPNTKTKIDRAFVIRDEFLNIVRKYQLLRPNDVEHDRFFINYINGKCTKQPIGRHKLAAVPRTIAAYLKLPNAENYTGHCFRRTSATLLADAGASLTTLKRHGGWKSSKVAEGYIEDSVKNKSKITHQITESINLRPSTSTTSTTSYIELKPQIPLPSTSFEECQTEPTEMSQNAIELRRSTLNIAPTTRSGLNPLSLIPTRSLKNVSVTSMPTELSQTTTNINVPGKNVTMSFNNCVCHIRMD